MGRERSGAGKRSVLAGLAVPFLVFAFVGQYPVVAAGDTFKLRDALSLGVEIEEELDTNIYNTYDLKNEFDFVTRVRPKVELNLDEANFFSMINRTDRNNKRGTGSTSGNRRDSNSRGAGQYSSGQPGRADIVPDLNIGLSLDLEYYALHPDLNSQNSGDNFFQPDFDIELYPDEGLKVYYRYSRTRNDISGLDPLGRSQDKDKVYTSTHRYGLNCDFGPRRDVWNFSYEHTRTGNEDEGYLDTDQDTWSLDVNVTNPPSYLPKVFFEYSGSRSTGGGGGDKVTHEGFAGLKGNFSPKITGEVKAGYGISSPGSNIFEFSNITGDLIFDADLNYNITKRVNIGFSFDKTQRNITSFAIDQGVDGGAGPALNIPQRTSDSWNTSLNITYTPPFFNENLRLTGTASQSEVEYSDGGTQKVQEFGFSYSYTFRGIQSKRYRAQGSDPGENNTQVNPGNKTGNATGDNPGYTRARNLFIFLDALQIEGEVRTRRVSPEVSWSRFNDNVISIKLKWEL